VKHRFILYKRHIIDKIGKELIFVNFNFKNKNQKTPIEKHNSAAWANQEKLKNISNVSISNEIQVENAKDYVDNKGIGSAIVIGGGFIGVEMAENLVERNVKVTLVEAAPHILAPFDTDMVVLAEKEMEQKGIELILGDGVKAFAEEDGTVEVTLNSEKALYADMVILAIGVSPDTSFLKDSGIVLGPKGHIVVNEKMETNVEGIYAITKSS
jgi:pyruvate/2-oxoglutarate dehydrogenase complex dihydrolipoamide dehydrogenase (E3) component